MREPVDIAVEPRRCTFRKVDARKVRRKALVELLAKAATPVLVEHLATSWPGYAALMEQHGPLTVEAVHNESVTSFFMSYAANTYSLAEYDAHLRRSDLERGAQVVRVHAEDRDA